MLLILRRIFEGDKKGAWSLYRLLSVTELRPRGDAFEFYS